MRKLVLLLSLFGMMSWFGQEAHASHFAGADFSIQCLGGDSFLVTFNLFRDCGGASAPTSANVSFASPCSTFNVNIARDTIIEVSQLCPTALGNSTCSGGNLPGMQQHVYSQIVVLPPCATGPWSASWTSCCRNPNLNIQSASSQSFWIDGQVTNNANVPCNSTPQFNAQPIPYVCVGNPVVYNFGVTEIDGDSLVFFFDQPNTNNSTNTVTFINPYTFGSPLAVPATLNSQTGELTFTPSAAMAVGNDPFWVIKICVAEYRNGVQIGQICRDIQFVVQPCDNYVPYMLPQGITNFTGTGLQIDSNSVEVCVGNTFSFDILYSDSLHPLQTFGDSVTLSSNIQQVLPGAIVNFTNGDTAIASVTWTAQPGSAPFNIFIINAIDDACNIPGIASNSFDITVVPSTFAGPDQRLCRGEDTAFVNVVGGTYFTWSVITGDPIQLGVNFRDTTGTTGQNVWMFPQHPTTYEVVSNLSGTCVNTDTITIIPSRNFTLNMFGDTLVCPNDSLNSFLLSAVPDTGGTLVPYGFSYQWNNGAFLDFDTLQSPTASLVGTRTFTARVESDSGCVKTGQVTVTFAPYFPDSLGIDFVDSILCIGDSTQASVNFGIPFSNSCGPATAPCGGATADGIVGTGFQSNASTTWPAAYSNWLWSSSRTQFLYTAAELSAMGMAGGGKINSIAFNVTQTNGIAPLQNFTIKVGCTNATNLSGSSWISGLTTVFGATTYTVTNGWNTHNFSVPYDWDGNSNLVVEICYYNPTGSNNASNSFTTTPFQSVRYYRDFNNQNICTATSLTAASNQRPNARFNYCAPFDPAAYTYQWSPSNLVSNSSIFDPDVFPTVPTTFFVTVSDTFGACVDTATGSLNVTTFYNAGFSLDSAYCFNDSEDTAVAITPGGVWIGPGITDSVAGIFDPAVSGPGSHQITYRDASPSGNCVTDSIVIVEVVPLPDPTITSPLEFCRTGGPYQLTAATGGGQWLGLGVVDSNAGIYDPLVTPVPGTYPLYYVLNTPCFNADTVQVRNYDAYTFDFIDTPRTVCINDTLILSNNFIPVSGPNFGTGPAQYTWSGPGITNPDSGYFDPVTLVPGSYTINLTSSDTNGNCATTKPMRVQVYAIDTPLVTNMLLYCDSDNSALVGVDKGFGSSANWTTNPIPPTTTPLAVPGSGSFNPSITGPGEWLLDYSYTNLNGCTGFLIDTITVLETPPRPVVDSNTFCAGEIVFLTTSSSTVNNDSLIWYDSPTADPSSQIGTGAPFLYGIAEDPGATGPIIVYVQEKNQICTSPLVPHVLPIVPDPNADFHRFYTDSNGIPQVDVPTDVLVRGLSPLGLEFQALNVEPGDSLIWNLWLDCDPSVDAKFGCPIIDAENLRPRVAFTYRKEGQYIVQLVQINEFGCADTISALHEVLFEAEVPNVFTPNGDGINDIFRIPGAQGLRDFNCQIYNRWGRKVYEWSNPEDGWDGSGYNDGVYYYIVTGKRAGDEDFLEQGTITLIGGSE